MLKKIIFQFLGLSFIFTYSAQSAESGGMPQLNPEFWISQIFWLVLTFGLLFIILSKFILPKISNNLETRKSQILENIETADKQREETEKKVKEFDKIINDTKVEAKNFFNSERQKVLDDINNKRLSLEKDIEKEIIKAEEEIDQLKKTSQEKVTKIAIETSSDLVKQLIGEDINKSSLSAIVEDLSKKEMEKHNGI